MPAGHSLKAPSPRLYAILDVDVCAARGLAPLEVFHAWLDAGVRLIQLRAKHMPSGVMLDLAEAFARDARSVEATFIVNDRADIARLAGAAGVHLGQTDLTPVDARLVVGESAMVGVSTHNDEQARLTLAQPVNYVAIGPVFSTASKDRPDAIVGLDGVRRARDIVASSSRPLIAIGGITLERATDVVDAGADSIAVISDLLVGAPATRARAFLQTLR